MDPREALSTFDPRVAGWFVKRFGTPTDVQRLAWPVIADGEHTLMTAPTGCGKTLGACLFALERLATGAWSGDGIQVLYVSPLKALNNDVQKNLLQPLHELREIFGDDMPEITVAVRSGDTPQADRRRMLRKPPSILVTTPESLNLLLSSSGREILRSVRCVVLDEIHAVAGSKRGVFLMAGIERLVELSGEVQRIALSATVSPLELVAEFVAGYSDRGEPRRIRVLKSEDTKELSLSVRGLDAQPADSAWPGLVVEFKEILKRNRSTLFFVNNRGLCENLARWLNEGEAQPVAYSHHGSLSREIRELVEQKLKAGELKALVATSSLELGIDVGWLDEVVLVQSPRSLNGAQQRIGRAGHEVGRPSRGTLYPTHGRDFLDAAVLAPAVEARATEAVRPIRHALDVLAQVVLAMAGVEPRTPADLLRILRRTYAYRTLTDEAYERVLAMLQGVYSDARIRELRPRIFVDPETGLARARDGALSLVYRSGGVIPDRGYFHLRTETGARLGELDEEFVWERSLGDEFSIGNQTWRVQRITKNDVIVAPGRRDKALAPFWRAEVQDRGFEFCERIGAFLENATDRLDDAELRGELPHLDDAAFDSLLDFLRRQKAATQTSLPHRHNLLIEHLTEFKGGSHVILHAGWGGKVLRPWSVALAGAWRARHGPGLEVFHNDDCVLLHLPEGFQLSDLFDLVTPENVEKHVRHQLERTGFFGARFRENAGRALLLPRFRAGHRMPLWLNRLRAKKLLSTVGPHGDFPIVTETWRTCIEDEFDLPRLKMLLDELRTGAISVTETHTSTASPFAKGVIWRSTGKYVYDDDTNPEAAGASLTQQALDAVLHDAALRPKFPRALVNEFEAKLQRRAPGYQPQRPDDFLGFVEERLCVPREPWSEDLPVGVETAAWSGELVIPTAQRARIERMRNGDLQVAAACLGQVAQYRGPFYAKDLEELFGVPRGAFQTALAKLVEEGALVADRLTDDTTELQFCDRTSLERLLRLHRGSKRARLSPKPIAALPYFLARLQGLATRGQNPEDLRDRLGRLFGHVAPAAMWEESILPARLAGYDPDWLEDAGRSSDLAWFGAGNERCAFCFLPDASLFLEPAEPPELLPDVRGGYDFFALQQRSDLDSAALTRELWRLAWDGRVTNDDLAMFRRGIETRFEPAAPAARKRGFSSWQSSRPLDGVWRAVPRPAPADLLEAAEDNKERVRILLQRYGVLFRELVAHELPALRWSKLAKTLRIMELSGEILGGLFFDGVTGLQFASHEAFRLLQEKPDNEPPVFGLSAADPASACGLGLELELPSRLPTTFLIYRGDSLLLVAKRSGREIELPAGPPDPEALVFFREQLQRRVRPPRRIEIEQIDGAPARESEHTQSFLEFGFRPDRLSLVLERSY